ncbi:MAG: DUF5050 domain-containing protein [Spirochaetes bacterium]|nr:DUF5050 domain-containing protein [Spirochaetota bacterium]
MSKKSIIVIFILIMCTIAWYAYLIVTNMDKYSKFPREGLYYFINYNNDLYKIRFDGFGLTKMDDGMAFFIEVLDGWVYYNKDSEIHRIKTNNTSKTKLTNNTDFLVRNYKIKNNKIIYIIYNKIKDSSSLYSMDTNGSNKIKLANLYKLRHRIPPLDSNWLYYPNHDDQDFLYRITHNGKQKTKIGTHRVISINQESYKDWIIYLSSKKDNSFSFIKTKKDGSEEVVLVNVNNSSPRSYELVLEDNWIHYTLVNSEKRIEHWKVNVDTKENIRKK